MESLWKSTVSWTLSNLHLLMETLSSNKSVVLDRRFCQLLFGDDQGWTVKLDILTVSLQVHLRKLDNRGKVHILPLFKSKSETLIYSSFIK